MEELVGTYSDEWSAVVKDPERKKQFRQFANTVNQPTRRRFESLLINTLHAGRALVSDGGHP
jgi:hypothetical protein